MHVKSPAKACKYILSRVWCDSGMLLGACYVQLITGWDVSFLYFQERNCTLQAIALRPPPTRHTQNTHVYTCTQTYKDIYQQTYFSATAIHRLLCPLSYVRSYIDASGLLLGLSYRPIPPGIILRTCRLDKRTTHVRRPSLSQLCISSTDTAHLDNSHTTVSTPDTT